MKTLCTLLALALLAGCVTGPATPRPRVFIEGKTAREVRTVAADRVIEDRKWQPVRAGEFEMMFEKDLPFGAQIFVQEIGGQPARHRLTLMLLERTGGVDLIGDLSTITTRWGNPQRHANEQQDHHLRWLLDCIRARALGESEPPLPPPPPPTRAARGKF